MKRRTFPLDIDGQSAELVAFARKAGEDLILFVHGLGCSKDSFNHFWNRTDFQEYSALAPDLIGFGESAKPFNFSYTMEAQTLICSKILANFEYKNLHLVAHSMGAAVALLLPEEILNGVKSFTNIEGNLIGADCGVMSRKIISVPPSAFASDILPELLIAFNSFGKGYTAFEAASTDSLYKSAESLVAWSDSGKLLEIFLGLACPRAYFYGDENSDIPVIARISDVLKVKIKHSGHFPMNDNPEGFYDQLHTFLKEIDNGSNQLRNTD